MRVAYATKPLALKQLAKAVAIGTKTKSRAILESSIVHNHDLLLDVCANLVIIDHHPQEYLQSTVRFVHYSVQAFFYRRFTRCQQFRISLPSG